MPELVVVFNTRLALAESWREKPEVPDDLIVLADPEADLYEGLETKRASSYWALLRGAAKGGLQALREGRVPHATKADMLRLGADVAVRADGSIALLHRAETADDRVDPAALTAALR